MSECRGRDTLSDAKSMRLWYLPSHQSEVETFAFDMPWDPSIITPLGVIGVGGAVGLGFWGLIRKIDQISKNTVVKHYGELHVARSEEKLLKSMESLHKR